MTTFNDFGLAESLSTALQKMNYSEPTPVQAEAIPLALQGHDILGSAQTGTGKTAAFGIPAVQNLIENERDMALIITPTRELAKQVLDTMRALLSQTKGIKTALIIGGERMGKQFEMLKRRPRLIVGTPGRINDHLDRGSLKLGNVKTLVLDETDRMLDMGFGVQIDAILKHVSNQRQTLLFSATLPKGIQTLAQKYLNEPERVAIGQTNAVAKNITHDPMFIEQPEKFKTLMEELNERQGTVIVFVKTKRNADRIAQRLKKENVKADAMHGDLKQNRRNRVLMGFRKQKFRVLVATDIAARGLDVPHIEHVISYDLPQLAEDYIHRMGRTARAGASGEAICFIASHDVAKWHEIQRIIDPENAPAKQKRQHKRRGSGRKPYGKKKAFGDKKRGDFRRKKPFSKKRGASNNNSRPQRKAA